MDAFYTSRMQKKHNNEFPGTKNYMYEWKAKKQLIFDATDFVV